MFEIGGCAEVRKALATDERLCLGTESKWLADECMDLASLWYCKSSVRYGGWPVLRIQDGRWCTLRHLNGIGTGYRMSLFQRNCV